MGSREEEEEAMESVEEDPRGYSLSSLCAEKGAADEDRDPLTGDKLDESDS